MPSTKPARLLTEERRRMILELLEQDGRLTVGELVERFGVSSVTVRTDLDALAATGALVRAHGGAVRRMDPVQDYPVSFKNTIHHTEKVRIGRAAAQLIHPGQTAIIDSGSTALQVARHLKLRGLKGVTVVTNALNIATELADAPGVALIMIGGVLRQISNSFVGPQAERMLAQLHADHCFLGVDGLDPEHGPTTPDLLEAQLNSMMLQAASRVTAVADSSKLGKRSLSAIGSISAIHRLITDDRIPGEMAAAFHAKGLEIVTV